MDAGNEDYSYLERVGITSDNTGLVSRITARIQVLESQDISAGNELQLAICYFSEGVARLLVLPQVLCREAHTPSDYKR